LTEEENPVDMIDDIEEWRLSYSSWQGQASSNSEIDEGYPFVKNRRAPFTPVRRALPMLNLALISSAGAYIDGTSPFDTDSPGGDLSFREIPVEVEAGDLRVSPRGYDAAAVLSDMNSEIPVERLVEFERNRVIGQLNPVFWSYLGFIPDAAKLVDELTPKLVDRLLRYEVQAALLIPASRLCHQSQGLVARAIEAAGIPTMTLAVVKDVVTNVRPPRTALYDGEFGSVAGKPNWPEHQRRILDESLRLIESFDQPGIRKLAVELESQVEKARGER
jgi:D-proline reductase (dithiol) PrdB